MVRTLIVIEDRHDERELRRAWHSRSADTMTVVTSEALLAMRLCREGIDARLTTDLLGPDAIERLDKTALAAIDAAIGPGATPRWAALLGDGLGQYLEYSLIPPFMRAVRNVAVIDDLTSNGAFHRVITIGTGPLVEAARLVASHRRLPLERRGASPWRRLRQSLARVRAGKHTRWVGTEFRSLMLEPAFLLILFAEGLWRRLFGPHPAAVFHNALIITGDRWTADVVARLQDSSRTVIVAGATQPGRALFRDGGRFVPIEYWTRPSDILRWVAGVTGAAVRTWSRVTEPTSREPFAVAGVSFWPMVRTVLRLHLIIWIPLLRHLRSMVERVAVVSPHAAVLTSADATAYVGSLVAVARQHGMPSTTIQHGLMGEFNGHAVVRADVMAAWGPATERWHRAHAPQTARFAVTGNSRFDSLVPRAPGASPAASSGDSSGRSFTIVVGTSFVSDFSVSASESANLAMMAAVLDWARGREQVRVILKMHPGEEPDYYSAAATALAWESPAFTMTNKPILHDVLAASDVHVTGYSTTVIESVLLGTPVIVCDFSGRRLLQVDRLSGVTIAFDAAALHRQLDACLATGRRPLDARSSPELSDYVLTLDGRATDRIATLVETASHATPRTPQQA